MSEPMPARNVVRPIASGGARPCARPGCPAPASATLTFTYSAREVLLSSLAVERVPEAYDLCALHADRSSPPRGWTLEDQRRVGPAPGAPPADHDSTLAVLSAALGEHRSSRPAALVEPAPARARTRTRPVEQPVAVGAPAQLW